ncbi:MAG: hypothetical protein ACOC54_06050 [Candidatus Sumerlaeota bacterium]
MNNPDLIQKSTKNPHYIKIGEHEGALIGSGEHYGGLMNLDFDFEAYFQTLESDGLNLTRLFSGAYRELPTSFGIQQNTMAPKPERFICPWKRVSTDPEQYDLTEWNPEYFKRLHAFMESARNHGVIVEYVFFCFWYSDALWEYSPMNIRNNTNGIGDCPKEKVYSLDQKDLLHVQEKLVRKVIEELNEYGNLYYEIANELYSFHNHTACLEWQYHLADLIAAEEKNQTNQHLIAVNIQNKHMRIEKPHPTVSIYNYHYARPAAIAENYHLDLIIGDDETGFRGQSCEPYRKEAWLFMLSGGGIFSHLDYSFTLDHPDGVAPINGETPGFGGPEWRRQLKILKDFLRELDLVNMRPHNEVVLFELPPTIEYAVLADPGKCYALYFCGGGYKVHFALGLPAGKYYACWVNPITSCCMREEEIDHPGGPHRMISPFYSTDFALKIEAR